MAEAAPATPPDSSPTTQMPPWKWWRSLLAIIVGLIIDGGGSLVFFVCIYALAAASLMRQAPPQGWTPTELTQRLQVEMLDNLVYFVPGAIGDLLFSVLGGFVTGTIAGRAQTWHGVAMGLSGFLIAIIFTLALRLPMPTSSELRRTLVTIPIEVGACGFGGYLAYRYSRRRRKRAAPAQV